MKKVIYFLMFLLCINITLACTNRINYLAEQLKGNSTLETAYNIDIWVEEHNNYEYGKYKNRMCDYLNTGIGDCTDVARLKNMLLQKNNISSRLVHGYNVYLKDGNTIQDKHDWYEFEYHPYWSNKSFWVTYEYSYYKHLKKIGHGIW